MHFYKPTASLLIKKNQIYPFLKAYPLFTSRKIFFELRITAVIQILHNFSNHSYTAMLITK